VYITIGEKKRKPAHVPSEMFHHAEQWRLWESQVRMRATCAGRRSGKSDQRRRHMLQRALLAHEELPHVHAPKFIIGAPTRDQVKRIHWEKLKQISPPHLVAEIRESDLSVRYLNGAAIWLVGFDKPARAEGEALHGAILDEIADMKEEAWTQSVRPSLGTMGEEGWCDFIGKPRGRNHWWRIWTDAAVKKGWEQFHWSSEDILPQEELDQLKEDLDPITYDQEVRANFVNFSGRTYYPFIQEVQAKHRLRYEPKRPLDLCFDFNVEPGICEIAQSQFFEEWEEWPQQWLSGEFVQPKAQGWMSCYIDEVWFGENSNTLRVVNEIKRRWGGIHKGVVRLFGDATGGARKTSATSGSDWDIIIRELKKVPGWIVKSFVQRSNPPERDRVNSFNARLMSADGTVRTMIDPYKCPYLIQDLDGVVGKKDGSGEIDKSDKWLTHCSDGAGYREHRLHPVRDAGARKGQM